MDATRHERLLIRNEVGAPVSKARFDKDAMLGLAPAAAAYYGRRHLYRRADVLEYGRRLLTQQPRRFPKSRGDVA